MTARLPDPGGDYDVWGEILNDFLKMSHNVDGTLLGSALSQAGGVTSVNGKSPSNGGVTLSASDIGAPTTLGGGSDVSIATPSNNQVLAYNGSTSKWTNATLTESDVTNLSADLASRVQIGGDLGGTASAPSVSKLQGTAVNASSPGTNQVLAYNGSQWVPSTVTSSTVNDATTSGKGIVELAGDLGGTASSPSVVKVSGIALPGSGPTTSGQVLTSTGTNATAWSTPTTNATAIDGVSVTGTPTSGQVITASSGSAASWSTPAGGVTLDATAGDIQALGVQAAGSVGKAADAGHVHAMPRLDQVGNPTASVSLNSHKLTNLANGTVGTDAAAFGQIPTSAGSIGGLVASNNLSDLTSAGSALTNLGLGSAGGDLIGAYPNPTIAKINGVSVSGTPTAGNALIASSGSAASWSAVSGMTGWVNVKTYGAAGNGTTDDSAAILSALATITSANTLYLPAGQYLLNSSSFLTLSITGTRIIGDGPGASIIKIGGSFSAAQAILITAGYCSVENLSIVGASSTITNNPACDGIYLQGGRYCRVMNIFGQYINGWLIESVATTTNAGYATMFRGVSGLNLAGGIHVQSNSNMGWGAQHFLSNINLQQIGVGSGANANLDAFRFEDCFDITAENFNAAVSDASTGSTINIIGNCASHYFTNMDLGCFPNASSMTNSVITIQDGTNGHPTDIRFVQGEAQQGATGLTVSGGATKCFFTNMRFFNNYSDGTRVAGTGSDMRFQGCAWDSNGQGATGNNYDMNWSGSATGSVYLSKYLSPIVATGNVGIQNPVNLAATGQAVPHFLTDFGNSGLTNSNQFTHYPPLVVRTDSVPPTWNGKLTLQSSQSANAIFTMVNSTGSPSTPSMMLQGNSAGDKVVGVYASSDSQQRLIIDSNGKLLWGQGGSTSQDTGLQRGGAGRLEVSTDSSGGTFKPVGINDMGELFLAPNGALGQTMPRRNATSTTIGPTSGNLYLQAVYLPAGVSIGHISFITGGTAKTGGTHGWYVLADSSYVVRAVTPDQTDPATIWGTINTAYSIATSATYVTTYSGLYYVGVMVAQSAGTTPTFTGGAGFGNANGLTPILIGVSNTGQTTPPVTGATLTTPTAVNLPMYAYVTG